MPAGPLNIVLEQGADYQESFGLADEDGELIDLEDAGYTAQAQVRRNFADYSELALEFDVDLDATDIIISASAAETEDLDLGSTGRWDLEVSDEDGEVVRWLQGRVRYSREVTRSES